MLGLHALGAGPIAGPEGAVQAAGTDANLDVEIAFTSQPGAEIPAYVSVAQDVQSLSYSRGKQRELDRYQAGRGSVTLLNSDRRYDPTVIPDNLLGVYIANGEYIRGNPVSITGGTADFRFELTPDAWSGTDQELLWHYSEFHDVYVFDIYINADGTIGFGWANDDGTERTRTSTVPTGFTDGTTHWIRVHLDLDNGSSQQVVTFYTSEDGDSWSQLGSQLTRPFDTGVLMPAFDGGGDDVLQFGNFDGSPSTGLAVSPYSGYLRSFQVLDGNGADVYNPDFTSAPWMAGDGPNTIRQDDAGNYWLFGDLSSNSNYGETGLPLIEGTELTGPEGNIKPQKRIRVPVTYAGVTHYLIEGFIDSWDQQRRGPHTGSAVVSFTDGFKILNKADLASSAYVQEVLADNPVALWRLDEASGAETIYDSVGQHNMVVSPTASPEMGAQGLVSREPGSAMVTDADKEGFYRPGFVVEGCPLTVELVVQYVPGVNTGGGFIRQTSFTALSGFVLQTSTSGGTSIVIVADGVTAVTAGDVGTPLDDGLIHHLAATWAEDGSIKIYVDGVDVTNDTYNLTPGNFFEQTGYTGIAGQDVGSFGANGAHSAYQMAAIYNTALSAERVAAHADQVATPWNNDSPGERAARVLDAISWPESRRELDDGSSTLQSAVLGTSALEHVQKVAESEFGKVFISKTGNVRLMARETQWNRTPVGTITDDDHYQMSDPEYTDELIRNPATVSRSEGVAQTWKDQDGIDEYQRNNYTLDGLFHDSDELSLWAAQYIVDVWKDPQLRIAGVTIKPKGDPSTLFPLLLALELGDWITVEETPQDVGATTVHTAVVEGISLNWAPKDWTFTLSLSPADTRAYWLAGVEGFSEAGVSTRAGF